MPVNRSNQILIIVMIASFLTPFCGSSLNMSLPDIGREFHAGTSELSWVIETFLLTCAILRYLWDNWVTESAKRRSF